jgi:hypothetical protein
MRTVFLFLGIFAVATLVGARAEAQNYPWCSIYTGGSSNCGFSTYKQCMDNVSGIGGFCQENDTYKPTGPVSGRHKSQRHY